MDPKVSIIMGSTSDLPVMEKAAKVLNDFCIPFEINALSALRLKWSLLPKMHRNGVLKLSSPEPEWPHTYRVLSLP